MKAFALLSLPFLGIHPLISQISLISSVGMGPNKLGITNIWPYNKYEEEKNDQQKAVTSSFIGCYGFTVGVAGLSTILNQLIIKMSYSTKFIC